MTGTRVDFVQLKARPRPPGEAFRVDPGEPGQAGTCEQACGQGMEQRPRRPVLRWMDERVGSQGGEEPSIGCGLAIVRLVIDPGRTRTEASMATGAHEEMAFAFM